MRPFLTLILFLTGLSIHAAQRDCLIVHFSDGSYVAFPLDQSPRVTFEGNTVHIADQHYQVSNVRKYTIGDSEHVGIIELGTDSKNGLYHFDGDNIVLKVGSTSQKVRLHTIGGIEIPIHSKPDVNGFMRISLPNHSEQVYLLTIGNETIKIRKP